MSHPRRIPRWPGAILLALVLLPWLAAAQGGGDAPVPTPEAPAASAAEAADPPALVGRVARIAGALSLRPSGQEGWRPARPNEPVVAGDRLLAERHSRAALEFARIRLALDGGTELQVDGLDDRGLRATLEQGVLHLRLLGLAEEGGLVELAAPGAKVTSALDGRILVEARGGGGGGRDTRIAVLEGAALVTADGREYALQPGEALRLADGAAPQREPAGAGGPLVAWAGTLEPRQPPPAAARAMTGVDELRFHGTWDTSPDYGDVWYPWGLRADWVPYADGAWQWREPWGWIWVDALPWGFVTSHYGRWVRLGPRWGWAPAPLPPHRHRNAQPLPRPAWVPATVDFIAGSSPGRPVGWVPLGPREPWLPWFRASPGFVERANLHQVPDPGGLRRAWRGTPPVPTVPGTGLPRVVVPSGGGFGGWDGFAHRHAATVVPSEAMLSAARIRRDALRLSAPGAASLLPGIPPPRPDPRGPADPSRAALRDRHGGSPPWPEATAAAAGASRWPQALTAPQDQLRGRDEAVLRFQAEQRRVQADLARRQQLEQAQRLQAEQLRWHQGQWFQAEQLRWQQVQRLQVEQLRRHHAQRFRAERLHGHQARQTPRFPAEAVHPHGFGHHPRHPIGDPMQRPASPAPAPFHPPMFMGGGSWGRHR